VNDDVCLGDPGLLLPLIYTPRIRKEFRLGIIPHYIHYELFKSSNIYNDILIIKLADSNIERIIDQINSCDYTISTSLHGLIVSHAYGIKSIWYKVKNRELQGDDIKFYDYFSSVKIPEYRPNFIDFELDFDLEQILENVKMDSDKNHIKTNLLDLQIKLLKCAPFKLKEEFLERVESHKDSINNLLK